MTFDDVLEQALEMLRRRGRVSYRALKVQFQLDDDVLALLRDEIVEVHQLARDQEGTMLVWTGDTATGAPRLPPPPDQAPAPLAYTPPYLAEKILTTRSALEGERKQVTVLFADLKGSMELLAERDPEDARQLIDPVLEHMMTAVHRYEGTVNQVMGDGIMALFGALIAHEDHAARACYAVRAMQEALQRYAEEVRRAQGLLVQMRVGLHSGEVVVRAIGNDLHMDYSAVGQTTHLAARMEQLAASGSVLLTAATLRLVEGLVRVQALGPVPVKGLAEPVEVFELVGVTAVRRRLQAAVARGLSPFVGRQSELETLQQALTRAGAGQGQVVALLGEPGVGKSRLVYEFLHAHHTQGWLRLESSSVSYGKATAYLPVCDLLTAYCHIEDRDDIRTVRAKITGQLLTLDDALQDTVPAVLALFEALPADSPFLALDPLQRRRRTLEALKRVLLRESQVQPLLLVFEDLHWIDSETQAVLDMLVESLPTTRVLWQLGYPDQALQHSQAACTLAQEVAHPYSLVLALVHAATVHQYRREVMAVHAQAAAAMTLATEQGFFAERVAWATLLHGWALAMQGQGEAGLAEMRHGLAADLATGSKSWQPYVLGLLAEAYGAGGHPDEGLHALAEALAVLDTTELRYYAAELSRLQGALLLQAVPDAAQAEACFQQALAIARQQQAKSWELRAAMSLSRLWEHQGKRAEAYELLAPIYGWFTEGFDTADIQEAQALLEELVG